MNSNEMEKLSNCRKLLVVKLLHTAIWAVMAAAVFYILYAGIFDRVGLPVWLCVGLILIEAVVLLICGWRCPLTLVGQRYTNERDAGFDIFLPSWLAKHNKIIFTSLFVAGLALSLWRAL